MSLYVINCLTCFDFDSPGTDAISNLVAAIVEGNSGSDSSVIPSGINSTKSICLYSKKRVKHKKIVNIFSLSGTDTLALIFCVVRRWSDDGVDR